MLHADWPSPLCDNAIFDARRQGALHNNWPDRPLFGHESEEKAWHFAMNSSVFKHTAAQRNGTLLAIDEVLPAEAGGCAFFNGGEGIAFGL